MRAFLNLMKPGGSLLVCGNLNVDMIYSVPKLPSAGESVPVYSESVMFGGCGGNISLAASGLGLKVRLSAVVGEDFNPDYRKRMVDAGVDLGSLVVDKELPSPKCVIMSDGKGLQSYAFMMGAMEKQIGMEMPDPKGLRCCHIATSDPFFSLRCAREMERRGVDVSLDPGQEIFFRWSKEELRKVLGHCRRFFGNMGEWRKLGEIMEWEEHIVEINGCEIPVYDTAPDLFDEAVITLSESGSVLITGKDIHRAPAYPVSDLVDATGAGDAFRGGFYAAVMRGIGSPEALLYGNKMGSLVLSVKGPQEYTVSWKELKSDIDPAQLAHQSSRIS
jgi:sugar/nucleoside kinase (ribokinase family)